MLKIALFVVGGISLLSGIFYGIKQKTRMMGFAMAGAGVLCIVYGLAV